MMAESPKTTTRVRSIGNRICPTPPCGVPRLSPASRLNAATVASSPRRRNESDESKRVPPVLRSGSQILPRHHASLETFPRLSLRAHEQDDRPHVVQPIRQNILRAVSSPRANDVARLRRPKNSE